LQTGAIVVSCGAMRTSYEDIEEHAQRKLGSSDVADYLERCKSFLKVEEQRLRMHHRMGMGGGALAAARSKMIDIIAQNLYRRSLAKLNQSQIESQYALVALGGYGRRELAPYSDIDILFLCSGKPTDIIAQITEEILHTLWDVGLSIGHSCRSLADAIEIARSDLHSRTAVSEARFLAGSQLLFERFREQLTKNCFKHNLKRFIEDVIQEQRDRHVRSGGAVCLQEPNIKDGVGGLRDMHTVLWIAHAKYGSTKISELKAAGLIDEQSLARAERAYSFLLRVRNEAHFLLGRKADTLTLEMQPGVAAGLGYSDRRTMLASEVFMRDYYLQARELKNFCESFISRALEPARPPRWWDRFRKPQQLEWFLIDQGKLHLSQERGLEKDPGLFMDMFRYAQASGAGLSDQLKEAVRRNLDLIDKKYRSSPQVIERFLALLREKGKVGRALRLMHELGFLGRLMPEFGRITCLVQHDLYHAYTIDEHTLTAIEALDELALSQDQARANLRDVLSEVQDRAVLYLGLMMHDIGKGRGKGHVLRGVRIAERVCKRVNLEQSKTDKVCALVKHHLLMAHISQRRDLTDPKVIGDFSAKIADLDVLNMLLLLTYSDINGVAPGIWNEWKGALLWELYLRARAELTKAEAEREERVERESLQRSVAAELKGEIAEEDVVAHFAALPQSYGLHTGVERVAQQVRLAHRILRGEPLALWCETNADGGFLELHISARDCRGLFAKIAGTFTAHGFDILSAQLYTRTDGPVVDTIRVRPTLSDLPMNGAIWQHLVEDLKAALENRKDVGQMVEAWKKKSGIRRSNGASKKMPGVKPKAAPRVTFDNEASLTSTVIEVRAEDEMGLCYKIASALSKAGLNIVFAKVATEKNLALDVFYVTDREGKKLEEGSASHIAETLIEELSDKDLLKKSQ